MRKIFIKLLLGVLLLGTFGFSSFAQVVISQVYGGGGNSGATYKNDFIEIFNRGNAAVNLSGWSVQYASATGTSWQVTALTGSIAPGQYYLIQEAAGSGGTTALPTPDATGSVAMSGTAGKIALVNSTTALSGSSPSGSSIMDFVGFGTTANYYEGSGPTPAPSNSTSVSRANNGCTDTDNNAADFTAGTVNPRNTASAFNICGGGPVTAVSIAAGTDAAEPSTNGTFTISFNPQTTATTTLNVAFSGTAINGTDYTVAYSNGATETAGVLTVPSGVSSVTVTITPIDDNDIESDETISLTLSNPSGGYSLGASDATITITSNDAAPSSYISLVNNYTQDFNSLANTGTSDVLPQGWLFNETGSNANTIYTAGTGSSTGGDTYSFGASASTDRALGTLQSGALISTIGAQIQNNSGTTITKLKITYTGEEWRLGSRGRYDSLLFQYSLDATNLTNGTWIRVNKLDLSTPDTSGTAGARDGNSINKTITYTLRNLNIPAGAVFLIRWTDFNASGSDDGLAIDDFTIAANPVDVTPPQVTSLTPANSGTDVPFNFTATIQFNEDIQAGTGNIYLKKTSDNSLVQTISVSNPSVVVTDNQIQIPVAGLQALTGYYFETDAGIVSDLENNPFAGITGSGTWSFTTGINLYTANFMNCTGAISDGFTQYSQVGDIVWACTPFGRDPNAPTGTAQYPYGVQINGFANGTNVPNVDWLISPSFDLTATTYPLLSFWSRTAFNGLPLQLKVSTDYTGGDPATATWVDINGRFPNQASNTWTLSGNINLAAFKQPNVHFAFVYTSTDDDGARWTLDDIKLDNSPTPPPPSLTVSTSDINFPYTASGNTSDKTFTFTGNDLVGDVTLTATGAFQLSKNGTSFSSSLAYTQSEANDVTETVYVRFAPAQNNQDFTGNITISTNPAEQETINIKGTSIDPATTLEVVNWNMEWFGSPLQNPANDDLQQQNAATVLKNANADIYALVEVVDTARLGNIVRQMPGYSYVVCNYGSHTNPYESGAGSINDAQKEAFVYKTDLFKNVQTRPMLTNGVNTAEDLSNPNYNYWSSGRYPFLFTADLTLNCVTQKINFIAIHAKANTSPTTTSYNRRLAGAQALHDTLQAAFANEKVILLGDFNDDLDYSITAGFTTTSWSAFTTDPDNFTAVTLPLSLAGKKSTVSYNDMIDQVVISNELVDNYLPGSATVLTDIAAQITNYGSTTTDHYPVFSRYIFRNTTAPVFAAYNDDQKYCVTENGQYTIPAITATDDCGDAVSYSYSITGATERNGTGTDASGVFNPGTSTITWTTADSWGNSTNHQSTVTVNTNPAVTIPDAYALPSGTLANTVYIGYTPASSITLTAIATGGSPEYSYSWSNGSLTATAAVNPTANTTYAVTVTDNNGCTATALKDIAVVDIRGGNNNNKVIICHNKGTKSNSTLVIGQDGVADHLAHGDMLGTCTTATGAAPAGKIAMAAITGKLTATVMPNPAITQFTISTVSGNNQTPLSLKVTDLTGRLIEQRTNLRVGQTISLGQQYQKGVYFVELAQGVDKVTMKLIKL